MCEFVDSLSVFIFTNCSLFFLPFSFIIRTYVVNSYSMLCYASLYELEWRGWTSGNLCNIFGIWHNTAYITTDVIILVYWYICLFCAIFVVFFFLVVFLFILFLALLSFHFHRCALFILSLLSIGWLLLPLMLLLLPFYYRKIRRIENFAFNTVEFSPFLSLFIC